MIGPRAGGRGRLVCVGLSAFWSLGCQDPSTSAVEVQAVQEPRVFTVPAAIDGSGETDVTVALNDFFRSVPDSSTVNLPSGARYRIEGILILRDRRGLVIEGNGATLFATTDGRSTTPPQGYGHLWPRSRQHLVLEGGSDIRISDLTIQGANPAAGSAAGAYVEALEGQHGIKLAGAERVELVRITITDTYGDFLYLGAGDGGWTRDVHVRESRFERSGRQGIAVTAAERVVVEGSHIGEVGRSIIDLEPNTASGGARDITFRGNTFGFCRHLLLAAGGRGPNVGNVEFLDNQLIGMQLKVVVGAADGSRRGPFQFLGNASDKPLGALGPMMRFTRVDGVVVEGNVQTMVPGREMTAVRAVESCEVVVGDNDFPGAAQIAVVEPFNCPAT